MPRVLEDPLTEVLQLIAPLGITSPLRVAGMTLPSGYLDHYRELVEEEVDSSDVSSILSEHHLGPGPRETDPAYQLEESPLEHRVSASIGDQILDQAAAAPPRSSQAGESSLHYLGGRELEPHGAVDGGFDPVRVSAAERKVEDGSRG